MKTLMMIMALLFAGTAMAADCPEFKGRWVFQWETSNSGASGTSDFNVGELKVKEDGSIRFLWKNSNLDNGALDDRGVWANLTETATADGGCLVELTAPGGFSWTGYLHSENSAQYLKTVFRFIAVEFDAQGNDYSGNGVARRHAF